VRSGCLSEMGARLGKAGATPVASDRASGQARACARVRHRLSNLAHPFSGKLLLREDGLEVSGVAPKASA